MNKKIFNERNILSLLLIFIAFLPLFSNLIISFLGGVFYFLIEVGLLIWTILFYIKYKNNGEILFINNYKKIIFLLAIFSIIYIFSIIVFGKFNSNYHFGPISMPVEAKNMIFNIPIWISLCLYLLTCNKKNIDKQVNLFFICFSYTIIISLIALFKIPNFSKNLASDTISNEMSIYIKLGASGYDLTYTLSIISPLFIKNFKDSNKKRWLLLSILSIFFVYKSGYFIAILFLTLNLIIYLALQIKGKILKFLTIFLLLVIFIIGLNNLKYIGEFLIDFSEKIKYLELRFRFEQIGRLLCYGDDSGSSLIRLKLYQEGFNGILNSPFLGNLIFNNNYKLTGHSTFLDIWSGYGFILWLLFILIPIFSYKYYFKNKKSNNSIIFVYFTFILISIFNPIFSSAHVFLIVIYILPLFKNYKI